MRTHYFSEVHPTDGQTIRFGKAADSDDSPTRLTDEIEEGVWDEQYGIIYAGKKQLRPYYGPEHDLTWYAWQPLPRSVEDLEKLKHSWYQDPIWDIEEAKGFEAHYEELLTFRKQKEGENEKQYQEMLIDKAAELGVPGNTQLARYVLTLEYHLEQLEERLTELEQ